jgi:hypothetical protein
MATTSRATEPDLGLVRICKVLMTTPDQLLGFDDARSAKKKSERDRPIDKLPPPLMGSTTSSSSWQSGTWK